MRFWWDRGTWCRPVTSGLSQTSPTVYQSPTVLVLVGLRDMMSSCHQWVVSGFTSCVVPQSPTVLVLVGLRDMMSSCHQWVVSHFTYCVPVSHCVGSGGTKGHDAVLSPVCCLTLHLPCTSLPLCWFWWDWGTWCHPVTSGLSHASPTVYQSPTVLVLVGPRDMMSSCHQWVVSHFTYRVPVSHCVGSGGTEGHDAVLSPVGCLTLHLPCTSLPLCWFWWDQGTWCRPVTSGLSHTSPTVYQSPTVLVLVGLRDMPSNTNGEVAWGDPEERSHQFCLLSSDCPASKRHRWPIGGRLSWRSLALFWMI